MPNLYNLIETHAHDLAVASKWDDVAAAINAVTILVRDDTPVTYAQLSSQLGDDARQLVAGTLRKIASSDHPAAGEIADAHAVLLNPAIGLSLDTDARQSMVELVAAAGGWPDELKQAIKARGVRIEPVYGETVTALECQSRWESGERDKAIDMLSAAWASCLNDQGINAALAIGDKTALITAMNNSITYLGTI